MWRYRAGLAFAIVCVCGLTASPPTLANESWTGNINWTSDYSAEANNEGCDPYTWHEEATVHFIGGTADPSGPSTWTQTANTKTSLVWDEPPCWAGTCPDETTLFEEHHHGEIQGTDDEASIKFNGTGYRAYGTVGGWWVDGESSCSGPTQILWQAHLADTGANGWDGQPVYAPLPDGAETRTVSGTRHYEGADGGDGTTVTQDASWQLTRDPDQDCDGIPDPPDPDDNTPPGCHTACDDGGSNDFDGLADYPADPGCSSAEDTTELGENECDDGEDNDGDGDYDWPADKACPDALGSTETATCPLIDPENPTEADIARCYAPVVYLHPKEKYFPMDDGDFIQESSLKWAHDKECRDKTVAEQGTIDSYDLGQGGYGAKTVNLLCQANSDPLWSNQLTRPYEDGDKPDGEGKEGFYLDLDDDENRPSVRDGDVPVSRSYPNAPTVYYTYNSADDGSGWIRYWFMYGFNKPADKVAGFVDAHEGEWEGDAVHFDEKGNALDFAYFQHNCKAEPYSWDQMLDNGYTEETTADGMTLDSPVVYSANGSHASYPKVPKGGEFKYPCKGDPGGQALGEDLPAHDQVSGKGARWEVGATGVANAALQPWFGFGGAWGAVSSAQPKKLAAARTGPLGVPHRSASVPSGW